MSKVLTDRHIRPLTKAEHRLCISLSRWLLAEMILHLQDPRLENDLLHDLAESNFEAGCCALSTLKLLQPEGNKIWRITCSPDEILIPDDTTRRMLDELLQAVTSHADHAHSLGKFGNIGKRPADPRHAEALLELERAGYLKWVEPDVLDWTDAFAPWLLAHYAGWSLHDISPAPDEEVDAAIKALPDDEIKKLSHWEPQFTWYFLGGWAGTYWADHKDFDDLPGEHWDVALAAGLYLRLHGAPK